ncbi:hypothetical protein, partial [Frankia sp. AgB32]|uniref:hypothetical protein n=1 Tax=Frankia sp. AgB32 TaxID=631119 RepID=UPI00200FBD48
GSTWSAQQILADRRTEAAPALSHNSAGELVMAWRGVGTDNHIYWSRLSGSTWTTQQILADRRTNLAPALG